MECIQFISHIRGRKGLRGMNTNASGPLTCWHLICGQQLPDDKQWRPRGAEFRLSHRPPIDVTQLLQMLSWFGTRSPTRSTEPTSAHGLAFLLLCFSFTLLTIDYFVLQSRHLPMFDFLVLVYVRYFTVREIFFPNRRDYLCLRSKAEFARLKVFVCVCVSDRAVMF